MSEQAMAFSQMYDAVEASESARSERMRAVIFDMDECCQIDWALSQGWDGDTPLAVFVVAETAREARARVYRHVMLNTLSDLEANPCGC